MRETEAVPRAEAHGCTSAAFREIRPSDLEESLVTRFATQVAVHRDCLAVRDPATSLTYGELDAWANGIAHAAAASGGGREPIALLLEQGAASVAGILGALKSRSPYVSLDPGDPRSPELIDRVGARVILTDAEHAAVARAAANGRPVVAVDETDPGPELEIELTPDDVAYVFYTSGSTGRPKGVYDSHRNVLHNVMRYTNTLKIAPADRLSLVQSPTFSGTVSTLFSALLNGASVFPFPLQERGVAALGRWLLDERITIYHSVPAIFRSLVQIEPGPFEDVRIVRLEGDRATSLDVDLHRRHFSTGSVLVNGLGLTEAGLVRQLFVDREKTVGSGVLPVGYPVHDMEITLLDDAGRSVADRGLGEIAVTSPYLALGYWGDPALTSTAFRVVDGRRTYRTGDLGRMGEDGCLEYLGRKDGHVKVLGNRVEPSEVEAELVCLPGIADAAVSTREGRRGEGQLLAYVTSDGSSSLTPQTIRDALAERLPSYMVPSVVTFVDELPVGTSGKIDRRALAAPQASFSSYPDNELERIVAGVWADVLEVEEVDADADFFALGGDSLAAAEAVSSLERRTGVSLPVSVLAGASTVKALAAEVRVAAPRPSSSLVVLRTEGSGTPLVLIHGNTGNALHYAELVRATELNRSIWALEHPEPVDAIADMARRHVDTLLEASPEGPHLLAGFCFGAIVAHEMACQLTADGHEVPLLALLGITPLEFPSVVSPGAWETWRQRPRPGLSFLGRSRFHMARARELPRGERGQYIATRAKNIAARTLSRVARRPVNSLALLRALDLHHPQLFRGRAVVVLHAEETAEYTADPRREWASLADEVEVVLLPGCDHAMLEEPGVHALAELLRARADEVGERADVLPSPR